MTNNKWLVLGGGAVFQEYYIKAFKHLGVLNSVTIIEPNQNTCSLLEEKKINVINIDFETFLHENNQHFDFAIITLPNHLHEKAIELCLRKNIAVLCEKPLVLTASACDRIIALENKTNQCVYTGMVRRFMPSYLALTKSLNLIGKISSVKVEDGNPFSWVADSYSFFDPNNGGVLADMGVHYLDLLYDIFGDLTPVDYKDDWEGGVEANVSYDLKNNTEINISLKLSRTEKLKNTFEINGENGKIWIEKDNFEVCFFSPAEKIVHEIRIENAFNDDTLQYIFESCFVEQLSAFISKNRSMVNTVAAKAVTKMIEWPYNQRKPISKQSKNTSYLITGGTGFIGTALIENLWQNGIRDITVPVRGYKNCSPIAKFKINLPRLNLLNYEAVEQITAGKQFIVHLAYATDGKNAYSINVEATKNVVKAACAQGVEAVVILSTMNVYGFPDNHVNEHTSKKPAGGSYGKSKKIMQDWCLEFAKHQSKTRIVVLNPTCVYGPKGKTYTTLPLMLAKANRFCWIDEGHGLANVVYIENLLDAIKKSLIVKEAHGQNFIISDGSLTWKSFLTPLLLTYASQIENLSTKDLLTQNFKEKTNLKKIFRYLLANYEFVSLINQHPILGRVKKTVFKSIPVFRNKLDGEREMEWIGNGVEELTKNASEPFNPPTWLNELFGNTKSEFSSKKANQVLGWKSILTIEEALNETTKWLREQN